MSGYGQSNPTAGAGASGTHIPETKPVHYTCGDCDATVTLKAGDAIRCRECGHRVLYKMRTNRMVQFEAR